MSTEIQRRAGLLSIVRNDEGESENAWHATFRTSEGSEIVVEMTTDEACALGALGLPGSNVVLTFIIAKEASK